MVSIETDQRKMPSFPGRVAEYVRAFVRVSPLDATAQAYLQRRIVLLSVQTFRFVPVVAFTVNEESDEFSQFFVVA